MLLGSRDRFTYWSCPRCASVQISAVPPHLSDYYPPDYFSMRSYQRLARSRVRALVDPWRVTHGLNGWHGLGAIAELLCRPLDYVGWLRAARLGPQAQILDVGCGSGKLLVRLSLGGLSRCIGVDPYIDEPIHYPNGVDVLKTNLIRFAQETSERFDLVIFNHSLEHVSDPFENLRCARGLLGEHGSILIRLPIAGCRAHELYGAHWCSLDPPRHLFVPTLRGVEYLASRAELVIYRRECDSTAWQFIGSELYRRDISAVDVTKRTRFFPRSQIAAFERRTRELNARDEGDQFALLLAPISTA